MRGLVIDNAGLAREADIVAQARFHLRQGQVMRAHLAEGDGPLGQGHQIARQIRQQRLRRQPDAAGKRAQPGVARGQGRLARRRTVEDVVQRVDARVAAQPAAVGDFDAAQSQAVHAVDVQARAGLRFQQRRAVAVGHADQQGRALLGDVGARQADRAAGDEHHFARIAQGRQRLVAQFGERNVGILALARRRGVQDGVASLQADIAGRDHLAHAQIGVRLVAGAALRRALGVGQHQVQVLAAVLGHARHAAGLDVERVAGAQTELQGAGGIVLIDAIAIACAAHDVLVGHQAHLALALQRARVGADDGAALRRNRDGDALGGMDIAQADTALGRIQAHRRVAVGRHHAVDRLHRQGAGQVDGQIARVAHVAHQRAGLQRLRAGAILGHERHLDGLPDRVEEARADIHHLQAVGPGVGDIGIQLRQLRARGAQLAVVDEDVAAVLVQAEAVREQELQFAARRQRRAGEQRAIVGEHGVDGLPEAAVAEVHVATVQRDRARRADIAVQRVVHPGQAGRVGARQNGLVGFGQRIEDIGPLRFADRAQIGQLQRVLAQLRPDRALARSAQHDALPGLDVQETVRRRHAFGFAIDIEDLFIDGRRDRVQQVVLDIAQRGRREIEEIAGLVAAAVALDILGGLRRGVGLEHIVARIGRGARQVGRREVHRDRLAHVRVQGQQAVILAGTGLVEHGVGQRGRQPDAAVRADDGVVGGVGAQAAHGVAEIDLVARGEGAQAAMAVIDDEHVLQLEAARAHGAQARGGAHHRRQALAPIVVVLGRLRELLVDHIVVDHLVAHRLHQILDPGHVQDGRQVIGIIDLALQLLVQRQHGRAQVGGRRRVLGLEEMRAHREHAAQVGRGETGQQPRRDAHIGKERLDQRLSFGRLLEQLELLIQHGLFPGSEQPDAVAALDQHVIGHIVLQADRLAVLGLHVVQVDAVVVLQGAVARHVAIGIDHRHDVHIGQGDDIVGRDRAAAGGSVQQLDRHRPGRGARGLQDFLDGQRLAAGLEGLVRRLGQRDHAAIDALDVIHQGLAGVGEAQFHPLALHQRIVAGQSHRGHARGGQGLLREAGVGQADAGMDDHAVQVGSVVLAPVGIVDIGIAVRVQILQLRLLGIDLAREHNPALEPGAIGALVRQGIAELVHHADDLQRAVVIDAQLAARQGAAIVGHEQVQAGQRNRLAAAQQRLDGVEQLAAGRVAQRGRAQVPAETIAQIHIAGVAGAARRGFRVLVIGQVAAAPPSRQRAAVDLQRALLERRGAKALLQTVVDAGAGAALPQARQAVGKLGGQLAIDRHVAGVPDVIIGQRDAAVQHQRQMIVAARHPLRSRTVGRRQIERQDAARDFHAIDGERDLAAHHPVGRVVQPGDVLRHRHARRDLPAQGAARQGNRIAGGRALDHRSRARGAGAGQQRIERTRSGRDGVAGVRRVIGVDGGDDIGRDIGIAGGQRGHRRARAGHRRQHGLGIAREVARGILAAVIAEHDIQSHVRIRVGRGQIAHIRGLERDQYRVEILREPGPAIAQHRQDLIDQQLLSIDLHIAVLAQRRQRIGIAIAADLLRQLGQLGLRQRQLQGIGTLGLGQPGAGQREADGQVGAGLVGGAGQPIGRTIEHALAARRIAHLGHGHRRGELAGHRVVDGELEAIDQAIAGHRHQLAQHFFARIAVQAVVVGQAHQASAIDRRLEDGLVVAVAIESHHQILAAALHHRAQVGAGAAQADIGHLQRAHARPIPFVLADLGVQVGQDLGRDRGIGLLGRRARIGLLAVQQRTAIERDIDTAQLRVHRGLRIGPVHRLDQHQVGIGHILGDIDVLVGAGRAAGQAGLGREALARINAQGLAGRADGAVAGVELDAVARHHGVARGRAMGEDAVQGFDIDRAGRRSHLLQRGLGAGSAFGEIGQADVVARLGAGIARGAHDIELDGPAQREGLHIDRGAGRRRLAVGIARQDAHLAAHGDRRRFGRRDGLDIHRLPIAHDEVAAQGHIAVAADIDGIGLRARAQEGQVDVLRSRDIEGEEFLLLLLDHLGQRGGLGAQPAAAAGMRSVIAHDHAGVELAVGHHEVRAFQRLAVDGDEAEAAQAGKIDRPVGIRLQFLPPAAFDVAGQDGVIQFSGGAQLVLEDVGHRGLAGIGHHGRHQHRTRLRIGHIGTVLGGVAIGQPAQRIDAVADQVELLGHEGGRGGLAGIPAHDPDHDLALGGLIGRGQLAAQIAHRDGAALAQLRARAIVVDPDPAGLPHAGVVQLDELVPDGVHHLVLAIEFVQIALAARRVDDFYAPLAIGADVDIAGHQRIGGLVVDVDRRIAVGHHQIAIAHRDDLAGQGDAAAGQADGIEDDGLRGVVETARDRAEAVHGPIGAV